MAYSSGKYINDSDALFPHRWHTFIGNQNTMTIFSYRQLFVTVLITLSAETVFKGNIPPATWGFELT